MSAHDDLRAANRSFYRAFETLNLDVMAGVWAHDGQVMCVHPGWPLASGWREVRSTWEVIFANTESIRFRITDEHVDARGELGWVVCVEQMASQALGEPGGGAVLATNLFRRDGEAWRLVHHHASPLVPGAAALPDEPPPGRVLN